MFWFVFIFALLAYGTCHIANMYREKAIISGESKIGLFEPSKCPFCQKCKILSFLTFVSSVFTVFLVLYSEHKGDQWNFIALDHASWEFIHITMVGLFIITLSILTYIHQEAATDRVKKLLHIRSK